MEKIIKIDVVVLEDKRLKIVDTDRKIYSIFRDTEAYEQFKENVFDYMGLSFEIEFTEKPNNLEKGTFYRTINKINLIKGD